VAPPLVGFSEALRAELSELKRFLFQHLYRRPEVEGQMGKARQVLTDLFEHHLHAGVPTTPPPNTSRERAVADYLAGMTDRFALREHQRLTGQRLFDSPA
jgi:dGTPase